MKTKINPKTFNKKLSFLLMAALSLIIVISGYLLFKNEARKIRQQKEQTLNAVASLKVAQIEKWYKDELEDASIISSNAYLHLLVDNFINSKTYTNQKALLNFLHQIKEEHDFADIIITDLERAIISSTNDQIFTLEPREIEDLQVAILQRKSVSTDLFKIANSGQTNLSFISTIRNIDKAPKFAIIYRWNPEVFLFPLVKYWPIKSQTSESYIFKVENDSIIYLNTLRHKQNTPLEFKLPTTNRDLPATIALSGFSGVTSGVDYRGQQVFAYVSDIKGTPWYLVSKIDKSELLSELPKLALFIASLALLSILFALLSTILIHNQRKKTIYQELYAKEKELRQHQEKFKVIMDSVGEGVIMVDLNGRIQYLNSRAEELTEWKSRDARGRDFHSIYNVRSEETGEVENNIMEKVINQGIVKELANHTILITKSGKEIPVMDTGAPVLDSDGTLIGIAIAFQDETERRVQRRLLIESEEKYKSLVETSQDAIFVNHNNRIVFINQAGIKLLGASSSSEIIGKSPFDFFHPDYHELIKERVSKISSGEKVPILEEKIINLNGDTIDVEVIAVPFKFNGDNAIQASLRDISEKKKMVDDLILAKEQADESNRLKTAFLQNLAHEIRTPMNGIVGFTQLLKESTKDPETVIQYLDIIDKSGERLMNLIGDLIDLSKIETGSISIEYEKFDLNSMLDELHQFFLWQAEAKGLSFEIENMLKPSDSKLVTDKTKMFQILSNLICNAIKFTNKGAISFGGFMENGVFNFYVKDTGDGVPKDKQDIIFERFIQADTSLNRGYEGAGLGLSISKAFVEKMGGEIGLQSEVGKGSTFFVKIPGQKEQSDISPAMEQEILTDKLPIGKELKILIAEDDATSSLLVEEILKPVSKEILKANNGSEAIELFQKNLDIDLILMDIKMPILDGFLATKEIRRFNKSVVIIAQTAYAYPQDKERALEAGCNGYIVKPLDRLELTKIIKRHLDKS